MARPRRAALILAALATAAYLSLVYLGQKRAAEAGPASPALHDLVIETKAGEVRLKVELAADPSAWAQGLKGRTSLPRDRGMLFLFPKASADPFWMKDTLIPLSVAFADSGGRILRIMEMEPCREDPCPLYYPGVAYRQALEVNRGWFKEHNVVPGDRWRLE